MGREATTQREMASPCLKETSKACFNNCCTCTTPFTRNPPSDPPFESASARISEFNSSTFSSISHPNTNFTNHESIPSFIKSFSTLENAYPQFSLTKRADEIRERDFPHLSLSNHVCLDYIGHGLFSGTPIMPSTSSSTNQNLCSNSSKIFFDVVYKLVTLNSQVLSNDGESLFESRIRKRIFDFMNVSEDDYYMIFTANKSSAFKILAEIYPFNSNRKLLTMYDHKNEAVDIMIENATKRGAIVKKAEFSWPNMRIQSKRLRYLVEKKRNKKNKGLFVFPLQSSLTGARYSYVWMSLARENGWDILLDASALAAKDMETLGLSLFQPDFLFSSFYKVFGENPSGFGCLFVKKTSSSMLNESNIGIVSLVPPQLSGFELSSDENSDIQENEEMKRTFSRSSYSDQDQLEFKGLDNADSLGLIVISNRAKYLVNWLVNALLSLKHPNSENGFSLVTIYGPKVQIDRGPALAFNVFDWKGEKIDPAFVQKLADRNNISISCGFLKNIRFSDKYREEKGRLLEKTSRGKGSFSSGIYVLNASFGCLTNFEDVYRLWVFVARFLDADFVEKERWRYMALNQKTIEI